MASRAGREKGLRRVGLAPRARQRSSDAPDGRQREQTMLGANSYNRDSISLASGKTATVSAFDLEWTNCCPDQYALSLHEERRLRGEGAKLENRK